MIDYICVGCNENCIHSEDTMRDMGILVDLGDGDEIVDVLCPRWGGFTEFQEMIK